MQPGHTVAGKYRIERLLGEGGMGAVYIAENVVLQKRVALKVLSGEMRTAPNAVERFMREAVAASQVKHPAIVEVYDAGAEDGAPWIAMELLQGESLRDRLVRLGRLPPHEAVSLVKQILPALAAVHERGIVHRDLKPDNLFIEQRDGAIQVKILDFGIAKAQTAATNLTSTGAVLGTAFYLAPEQARDAASVDQRTDIYAIGAVLYECMSGRTPYQAETVTELIARMFTEDPPSLVFTAPNVAVELANLVQACLSRDPNLRPQSARELLAHLDRLPALSSGSPSAVPIAKTFVHPTTSPHGASALPSGPPPGATYTPTPGIPVTNAATTFPVREKKGGGGALVWVIVAVLLVLALVLLVPLGVVAYFLMMSGSDEVADSGGGSESSGTGRNRNAGSEEDSTATGWGMDPFLQWDGVFPPDVTDVNGDGNIDFIGWIREIRVPADSLPVYLAAYDGTNGNELWRTERISSMSEYMNARRASSGDVIVTVDEGAVVRGFRKSSGELAWTFPLDERADRICDAGTGFVDIVTADDRIHRISLRDGSMTMASGSCDRRIDAQIPNTFSDDGPFFATALQRVQSANIPGMDVAIAVVGPRDGRIVAFGTRERGSKIPMIGVVGGWQSDLPASEPLRASEGPPDGAALTDERVYATYVHSSATKLVGFELASGRRLFETPLEGSTSEAKVVIAAGNRVYVSHWTWLDAFDGTTGAHLFRVGRWN